MRDFPPKRETKKLREMLKKIAAIVKKMDKNTQTKIAKV